MHITLLEPYFAGSHAQWAKGLQKHSQHQVELLTLPGRFWKWRMYGGAVELARQFQQTDFILATDMLDLGTFLALTRSQTAKIPVGIYFHENQITYPWSPSDPDLKTGRNNQYGFLNYTSALAADQLFFNSRYHQEAFLTALPKFLKQFPDFQGLDLIQSIADKCQVLHLGMELQAFDPPPKPSTADLPLILWNHRWEYDKAPTIFFEALFRLKAENIPFQVIVLGEHYGKTPAIFAKAKQQLANEIIHFGYTKDRADYIKWLWAADILPVSSIQDYFGGSVVEAMYCGTYPLLPNRLAYPEHIPESKKTDYLYPRPEDLYPLLKKAVLNIDRTRELGADARNFVVHYDWSTQISNYDHLFTTVINH